MNEIPDEFDREADLQLQLMVRIENAMFRPARYKNFRKIFPEPEILAEFLHSNIPIDRPAYNDGLNVIFSQAWIVTARGSEEIERLKKVVDFMWSDKESKQQMFMDIGHEIVHQAKATEVGFEDVYIGMAFFNKDKQTYVQRFTQFGPIPNDMTDETFRQVAGEVLLAPLNPSPADISIANNIHFL